MTQRLAGFPSGLLSILGSQSFGEAPKELSGVIVPMIDTSDLYLLSPQRGEVQIVAAPANGLNTGMRVPQGEVWRVQAGGIFVLTGVGVTLDWTPILESSGIVTPIGDTVSQVASTTRLQASKQFPFWLRAGDQLTVYISALVGAPTVSIAYLVSRFRA